MTSAQEPSFRESVVCALHFGHIGSARQWDEPLSYAGCNKLGCSVVMATLRPSGRQHPQHARVYAAGHLDDHCLGNQGIRTHRLRCHVLSGVFHHPGIALRLLLRCMPALIPAYETVGREGLGCEAGQCHLGLLYGLAVCLSASRRMDSGFSLRY
eukprot:2232898-Amphidinium_carterae.1